MKVNHGKVVSTSYTLFTSAAEEDFEFIEKVNEDDPLIFLAGHSGLPPKFEEELNGLSVGDTFNFQISADEAYGEYSSENVVDFDLDLFKIDNGGIPEGFLDLGNLIPFNGEDGSKLYGTVKEVIGEKVFIDFNHPLAGKSLQFEGEILEIRDATPEETAHGHVHNGSCSH